MSTDKYRYKCSVVMAVYNVEEFVAESIESVLSQSMPLDDIQLILVNDGSIDKSGDVCEAYKKRYPENIVYIKQKNAGVSAARNRGLKEVRGEYVNFLDSDDKLSRNSMDLVCDFLDEHGSETDMAAIKMEYFDAKQGDHQLNYKFKETKVIDLRSEYDYPQLSCSSTFIKSSVFANGLKFDEKVKFSEDVKILTEILLDKMTLGVLQKPTYYYRRRPEGGSAINSTIFKRSWYIDTPKLVFQYIYNLSKKKYGHIERYVQNLVMYDLQWRFRQFSKTVLSEEEFERYKETIKDLTRQVDDDIILAQRHFHGEYKMYVLGLKHGERIADHVIASDDGQKFYYNNEIVLDLSKDRHSLQIELAEMDNDDNIILEGYVQGIPFNNLQIRFRASDQLIEAESIDRPLRQVRAFGEDVIFSRNCFRAVIPLKKGSTIRAFVSINRSTRYQPIKYVPRHLSRFSSTSNGSYRLHGDMIIRMRRDGISIKKNNPLRHVWYELGRVARMLRHHRFKSVVMRISFFIIKPFLHKNIWIISDRLDAADDNGEALFRYITKNVEAEDTKVYFTVSKKSPDYQRLRQYGRVVNRDSIWYLLLFLGSRKIISSAADFYVYNSFRGYAGDFVDLYQFDYVFLQHGITKDDISGWLNKYEKNIKLFVTAAKPEYESIINNTRFGYGPDVVKLTGFPRYDQRINTPKNKLILAPTWRRNLAVLRDNGQLAFKDTEYYKFYNNLMNDTRLVEALIKNDMVGELYLHPSLAGQAQDFDKNEVFSIKNMPYSYNTAFAEGNILVTDYSSVAFDFAYLKKPVVYTQFDRKTFYEGHLYKAGYYSYEDDGFGPVSYDYETAIKDIVKVINGGCVTEKKYIARIERFFYKFDKNNSKRVYKAILDLDRQHTE